MAKRGRDLCRTLAVLHIKWPTQTDLRANEQGVLSRPSLVVFLF